MVRQDLDAIVERAYAVLGRARPSDAIKQVVFENCKYFDSAAGEFLTKRINDLDVMPGNLSKTLRGWYAEWMRKTGREDNKLLCPECNSKNGGFWVLRKIEEGLYKSYFSPCPRCNQAMYAEFDIIPPTKRELERSGGIVLGPEYKDSPLLWAMRHNVRVI